jgi:hypothetical protein
MIGYYLMPIRGATSPPPLIFKITSIFKPTIILPDQRSLKYRVRPHLTSNRPLEDWGLLLKDNAASSAILDRLLHHGHLLKFEGKSYRLKEAATRLSQRKEKKENEG